MIFIDTGKSRVYVYPEVVIKIVRDTAIHRAEVEKLKKLQEVNACVRLLKSTSWYQVLENVGHKVSESNLPENWEEQIQGMLVKLKKIGVYHGDLTPRNIMVKNGIMKFIDPWHDLFRSGVMDEAIVDSIRRRRF